MPPNGVSLYFTLAGSEDEYHKRAIPNGMSLSSRWDRSRNVNSRQTGARDPSHGQCVSCYNSDSETREHRNWKGEEERAFVEKEVILDRRRHQLVESVHFVGLEGSLIGNLQVV